MEALKICAIGHLCRNTLLLDNIFQYIYNQIHIKGYSRNVRNQGNKNRKIIENTYVNTCTLISSNLFAYFTFLKLNLDTGTLSIIYHETKSQKSSYIRIS